MKFFILILSIVVFSSCTNKYENLLKSNTAEVREFIMEGKNENISANLVCGMREKDYKINGYATELIEFGVLTFVVDNIDEFKDIEPKYVLYVGTSKYDGLLEKNPFDNSLVVDIKKIIDKSANVSAKIILGEYSQDLKLELIGSDWKINSDDVYGIVANKFKDRIAILDCNNVFEGEVYVKIINDSDEYKGDYYWYVSLISRTGGTLNMIISPYSKEILAINDTLQKSCLN